jgi:hypothetical protein
MKRDDIWICVRGEIGCAPVHLLDSGLGDLADDRDAVHSLDLVHDHPGLGHGHDALFVAHLLHEIRLLHGLHLRVALDHLHPGLELLGLHAAHNTLLITPNVIHGRIILQNKLKLRDT